jgi:hypothetical protein
MPPKRKAVVVSDDELDELLSDEDFEDEEIVAVRGTQDIKVILHGQLSSPKLSNMGCKYLHGKCLAVWYL